jgi:sugar transferase (PEP-CTERM system associated)
LIKIGGQRIPPKTLYLLISDTVLIVVGLFLGIGIRFHDPQRIIHYLSDPSAMARSVIVILACQIALYYNDLYDMRAYTRPIETFAAILQSIGVACLVVGVLYYCAPYLALGRGISLLAALTIILLLTGWRLFLSEKGHLARERERVLVLGTGAAGISLVREIISRPELHLKVVGFLDEKGENIGKSLVNPGIIGAVADVGALADQHKVDRLVLSLAERRGCTPIRELLDLKFAGIAVEDAHTMWEALSGRIHLDHLSPSWLILSEGFRKSQWLLATKRCADIALSLITLIVALPVMALVALAIWLEDGGPVLYRQERTGMRARSFQILKFRSMYRDAEAHGPRWAGDNDSRVTRVGRFIRKYRLDELPQLFNVLRGEMSWVGPRPERPVFCEMLAQQIPLYSQRHSVRPGITGWAQVRYQYGASVDDAKAKLEYDLFYIKHMSIVVDIAILFETAKVMLYGWGSK